MKGLLISGISREKAMLYALYYVLEHMCARYPSHQVAPGFTAQHT